jgi:hypothetical protein
MSKSQKAEVLFADIAQFVSDSQSLLEQGAILELAGLDENVRMLCEQVLELSQDERIQYADHLQTLMADLQKLGEMLVAHRDSMGDDIRGLPQHRKASTAYRTADATDDFGKKSDK